MRRKMKKKNLILTREKSQKEKDVLRRKMMKKKMTKMMIPMITASMNHQKFQKIIL